MPTVKTLSSGQENKPRNGTGLTKLDRPPPSADGWCRRSKAVIARPLSCGWRVSWRLPFGGRQFGAKERAAWNQKRQKAEALAHDPSDWRRWLLERLRDEQS